MSRFVSSGLLVVLGVAQGILCACGSINNYNSPETPRFDALREGPLNAKEISSRFQELTSLVTQLSYSIDSSGRYIDSSLNLHNSSFHRNGDGELIQSGIDSFGYSAGTDFRRRKKVELDTVEQVYDKYSRLISIRSSKYSRLSTSGLSLRSTTSKIDTSRGQTIFDYDDSIGLLVISHSDRVQKDSFFYDESAYPLRHVQYSDVLPDVRVEQWRYYPYHYIKTHELYQHGIRTEFEYWNYDSNGYRKTKFGSNRGVYLDSTGDTVLRCTSITVHRNDRINHTFFDTTFSCDTQGIGISSASVSHYRASKRPDSNTVFVYSDSVFEADGSVREWSQVDESNQYEKSFNAEEQIISFTINDSSGRAIETKRYKDGKLLDSTAYVRDKNGRIVKEIAFDYKEDDKAKIKVREISRVFEDLKK